MTSGGRASRGLEVLDTGGWRMAGIRHQGPYVRISETFVMLFPLAEALRLTPEQAAGAEYVAAYHDDATRTPVDQLRSFAGVTVSEHAFIGELEEERMPAGRYVRMTFIGPHAGLGEAWATFGRRFDEAGYTRAPGASYEVYVKTDPGTPPDQARTDLYHPITSAAPR